MPVSWYCIDCGFFLQVANLLGVLLTTSQQTHTIVSNIMIYTIVCISSIYNYYNDSNYSTFSTLKYTKPYFIEAAHDGLHCTLCFFFHNAFVYFQQVPCPMCVMAEIWSLYWVQVLHDVVSNSPLPVTDSVSCNHNGTSSVQLIWYCIGLEEWVIFLFIQHDNYGLINFINN